MKYPSLFAAAASLLTVQGATRESFDASWKFARFGDMPDGSHLAEPAQSPAAADFDASRWRSLDLPHDWAIAGPFRADLPNSTGKLPWAGKKDLWWVSAELSTLVRSHDPTRKIT